MDPARHQVGERLVDQAMPGDGGFAGEFARHDHELVMPAAVLRPGMAGMLVAVVEHFQGIGGQRRETLADQV